MTNIIRYAWQDRRDQAAAAPVEEMQARILETVEKFTRGGPQSDYITLLILRYQVAPAQNLARQTEGVA